jgi:hypothetical protein
MKKYIPLALLFLFIGTGAAAYVERVKIRDWYEVATRAPLPPPLEVTEFTPVAEQTKPAGTKPVVPQSAGLPAQINLAVPMVYQAPFSNWDEVHEETCEEASMLMIQGYLRNVKSYTRQQMEDELLKIVKYEVDTFGYFEDTTAKETVKVMKEYFGMKNVSIVPLTSAEQIKTYLASGVPVTVPASGTLLKNPNFRNGGPPYHMIVIKGYTKDGYFIANDPGTRLGADFLYKEATIMEAAHDWNGGDVLKGDKLLIVAKK